MGLFSRETRAVSSSSEVGWNSLTKDAYTGPADPMSLSVVFFCTNIIVESLCSAPVDVYEVKRTGERAQSLKPKWMAKPNSRMTERELYSQIFYSLISHGNAYILVLRSRTGSIEELHVLPSAEVTITQAEDGSLTYDFLGIDKLFSEADILHVKGLTAPGSLKGFSPLEAARRAIDGAVAADNHAKDYFANGSTMQGILKVPTSAKGDPDGTAQKARQIKENFSHASKGSVLGVLYGGVEYEQMTISNQEAQFLETRRFNKSDIAGFFRVPIFMVDPTVASSWGTGITEQNLGFIQYTLQPWAITVETAFSRWLLRESQYMKFNLSASLRARESERSDIYAKQVPLGILTVNEARELEDRAPIEGGDSLPAEKTPVDPEINKEDT